MMRTRLLLATHSLFLLVPFAFASPRLAGPEPHLTEQQAIETAKNFCAKIGQPVSAPATAHFPAPEIGERRHWLSRWEIKFTGGAVLEVVDISGAIAFYRNQKHRSENHVGPPKPTEELRLRVQEIIAASGDADEIAIGDAKPNAYPYSGIVQFSLKHVFGDISYYRYGVELQIYPDTGIVEALNKKFRVPPPETAVVNITGDQALKAALETLAAAHVTLDEPTTEPYVEITKYVLQPNNRWEPDHKMRKESPSSRVGWNCRFRTKEKSIFGPTYYMVWVDAETGAVIGGDSYGMK